MAIGTDVFIPKIVVPGKDGIGQVVAIGSNIQATGDNSIVIGNDAISGKTGSIALEVTMPREHIMQMARAIG